MNWYFYKKVEELKNHVYEKDFEVLKLQNEIKQLVIQNQNIARIAATSPKAVNKSPVMFERIELQRNGLMTRKFIDKSQISKIDIPLDDSYVYDIKSGVHVLDAGEHSSVQPLIIDHDDTLN